MRKSTPKSPFEPKNTVEPKTTAGPKTKTGPEHVLSDVDVSLLRLLQRSARQSNVELAKKAGLSPSACLRRIRALEKQGIIRHYVTLLDPKQLGIGASVFIQVSLERKDEATLKQFEAAITERSEVVECYLMTGDSDYLLRVVVADVAAFERFLMQHLTKIPGIGSIRSSFTLNQVKYTTSLPLDLIE